MSRYIAVMAVGVLAVGLLASCASVDSSDKGGTPKVPEATPTAPGSKPIAVGALRLELEMVTEGLDRPLFATHAGDGSGRIFVVEQRGTVRIVRDGKLVAEPFLNIRSLVKDGGERGLLGLAFSPKYKESGEFYVNYTDSKGTKVVRYTAADPASDKPAMSKPEVVLAVDQPYANHNGGCIVFGPDGRLWVGMGDGGSGGDPQNRAQNDRERLGKMLAIDVEGGGDPKVEIVAKGLRNPWRFSFDRETDDLWIADVGQSAFEEVNFIEGGRLAPGTNFGWNLWEGDNPYPEGAKRSREGFTFPVIVHAHPEAGSITGGYVYRGKEQPALSGTYIYGDYVSGWIAAARREGGKVENRIIISDSGIVPSSFGEDEAGEVYVCDYGGSLRKVKATP